MTKIHILLYYKFTPIKNTAKFAEVHLEKCLEIGLLGKVLVANEGINGSVVGTRGQTERYKEFLRGIKGFEDVVFKEELCEFPPFKRMMVKVKKEIIRLDKKVDINNRGKYISPEEFLKLYENNEDVLILDARNEYESKVGRFKNAFTPKINSFREFPKVAKMLKDKKDKKIVMYCTGGIRCEKASAYLNQEGFKDVSQLEGGIITFCQKKPNTVWEGKCFVFDERLLSSADSSKVITHCVHCFADCDLYNNCKNVKCNNLINICPRCEKENSGCCSKDCLEKYSGVLRQKMISNRGKKNRINEIAVRC
ncbi:MAG: rhodanese-related sulfurtransferase [Nanoarchaeota archaeon]|nr:rhodanese-related sulfurtransferase [Nanoarchaeota archaeon]